MSAGCDLFFFLVSPYQTRDSVVPRFIFNPPFYKSRSAPGVVLSVVSIALLFGMTWFFQSALNLLQQQVENDMEVVLSLQEKLTVSIMFCINVEPRRTQLLLYGRNIHPVQ